MRAFLYGLSAETTEYASSNWIKLGLYKHNLHIVKTYPIQSTIKIGLM